MMLRTSLKLVAFFVLPAAVWTFAGCGPGNAPPALPKSNEELQMMIQQEDAAVYDLESKQAGDPE